jgi:hypothetical protein
MNVEELRRNAKAARRGRGFSRKAVMILASTLVAASLVGGFAFASGLLTLTNVSQNANDFGVTYASTTDFNGAPAPTTSFATDGNGTCGTWAQLSTAHTNPAVNVQMVTAAPCAAGNIVIVYTFFPSSTLTGTSTGTNTFLFSIVQTPSSGPDEGSQTSSSATVTVSLLAGGGGGTGHSVQFILDLGQPSSPTSISTLQVIVQGT